MSDDEEATLQEVEEGEAAAPPSSPPSALPRVIVVAIGMSAHGVDSLQTLFANVRSGTGVAWLIAPRQTEVMDVDRLVSALSTASGLPASMIVDGLEPEADHIYVAPSDKLATFAKGRVHLSEPTGAAGERGVIDSLFVTLAQTNHRAAVGVLLAGLGPVGTAGLTALRECGGLLICERDHASAGPNVHPQIDPAGLADFLLTASEIPERLAQYLNHLRGIPPEVEAKTEADIADQINRVAAVLRNRTGHDFHGYKHGTFMRRIQRRMQVNGQESVDRYIEFLRTDADEVGHLFQDLLIGVTQFFRDKPEFEHLERAVIPKLFEGKGAGDQVRVWVLGCATGEEAYSIAMLLREHMATLDACPHVQIFATDIDGRALTVARAGRYPEHISKDVPHARLLRWFTKEGVTYSISKELREMCIFSQHNVVKDAPFSRIDLCSCRNLLIYLTTQLQDRVIPLFHFALRSEGYLMLGSSENVTRHVRLFAPVDRQRRIFKRLDGGARVLPQFPLTVSGDRGQPITRVHTRASVDGMLGRQAERIAERHAPAYVLVDADHQVLSFSGRTGRYIEPAAGAANLSVVNLIHRDLRVDLRAALQRAALDRAPVKITGLLLDGDSEAERRRVTLVVEPLSGSGDDPPGYVVLFREEEAGPEEAEAPVDAAVLRDEHVKRLESELRLSRERLQATIEELESTNEELKSSNEEYQSINEELQSANEELETSKEELQSVNEELQTVNGELGQRVNDLGRANGDLKNLLEATQIATVFLDNDLRIKNFTPSMADVFHLIDTDVGRPLNHIASRLSYPDMQDDVRKVLRSLGAVEREISGGDRSFHVRVLPYRSLENYIAGVVMTFLDVTDITKAQADLLRSESKLRDITDLVPDLLWSSDAEGMTDWFNQRWLTYAGQTQQQALGRGWFEAVHPEEREQAIRAYAEAANERAPFSGEHRLRDAAGRYQWFRVMAVPAELEGETLKFFGAATNIEDYRRSDAGFRLMVAELQHRARNILAVVRSIATGSINSSTTLEEFSTHFDGRIEALARTQGMIARQGHEGVELEDLVRDELAASAPADESKIEVSGPAIVLRERAAEAFALALHELATNAVKYGALAAKAGKVTVEWRVSNTSTGPRLSLEWRESGVAAMNTRPTRSGFGRDLIEQGLPYDLGAVTSLSFEPGGVRCSVELPLSDRVVAIGDNELEKV